MNFSYVHYVYRTPESEEEGGENKWRERIGFRGRVATFKEDAVVNCIELWIGIVRL